MKEIDLKISGSSSVMGGEYNTVSISGAGKINGNLKCDSFSCSGSGKVLGDLEAESIRSSGSTKIEGAVQCQTASVSGSFACGNLEASEELKVSGGIRVSGSLRGGQVRISGSLKTDESIHCREMKVSGTCEVQNGDLNAEFFRCSGVLQVPGLLNAETVEIYPTSASRVGSIGGTNIRISTGQTGDRERKGRSWAIFFFDFHVSNNPGPMQVDTIEGDTVELEYTRAHVVRGTQVRLGKGCKIDRVEYSESLDAEEGTVEEAVKV